MYFKWYYIYLNVFIGFYARLEISNNFTHCIIDYKHKCYQIY